MGLLVEFGKMGSVWSLAGRDCRWSRYNEVACGAWCHEAACGAWEFLGCWWSHEGWGCI
jgi:hypothetical protein